MTSHPTTAANLNAFEGTRFLLGKSMDGNEWVSRYSIADMEELFSAAEIAELNSTGMVLQPRRDGGIMWIDMVASARDAFINA